MRLRIAASVVVVFVLAALVSVAAVDPRHGDLTGTVIDPSGAGEIGAGHSVTALYEIVPPGLKEDEEGRASVDPLKYQRVLANSPRAGADELMTVKVRYKAPDGDASRLVTTVLRNRPQPMTANLGFASAVAELGMLLRDSPFVGQGSYDAVVARARGFRRDDPEGYRAEFVRLAELAGSLGAPWRQSR